MRDHLFIFVNGARHEVAGESAFQSLSDFLRYGLGLVGTKVVCAEGDCGSCTVFLGRVVGDRIRYETVCACIQFLYQLDCTHIVTVEGLKQDGRFNAVQEAMIECQGTQCGFCTPGFVVSMSSIFEEKKQRVTSDDVRAACIGNLCRCTGYEPILRAGERVNPASMKPLNELYPPAGIVRELSARSAQAVLVEHAGKRFFKPVTVQQAVKFRRDNPTCTIIAGGTDIGVQINKCIREPKDVLALSGLSELRFCEVKDGAIVAGALASIAQLESAARDWLPEYATMLGYFGSPPIRNAGTVGGNIGNGSPIADTTPAMYVLNAEIELTGPGGSRRVNINSFYTGYKRTVAQSDEIITRVIIPLPEAGEIFKLYKISRRKDLDISAFTAAIWMKRDGESITECRIAYGGVGPNIIRLTKTEDYFRGKALTAETVRQAGILARGEITPISDVRGSKEFRLQLGENILRKLYAELSNGNGIGMTQPKGNANGR